MSNEVTNMMLNDSKDLLDSIEITTIAAECVKLKQKEDEIASLEEQLKSKKAECEITKGKTLDFIVKAQDPLSMRIILNSILKIIETHEKVRAIK